MNPRNAGSPSSAPIRAEGFAVWPCREDCVFAEELGRDGWVWCSRVVQPTRLRRIDQECSTYQTDQAANGPAYASEPEPEKNE